VPVSISCTCSSLLASSQEGHAAGCAQATMPSGEGIVWSKCRATPRVLAHIAARQLEVWDPCEQFCARRVCNFRSGYKGAQGFSTTRVLAHIAARQLEVWDPCVQFVSDN
jgi:hypothetical protein